VEASRTLPGLEALDYAFKFASAIETDPKDMSRAQYEVVQELNLREAHDEAHRKAEQIEGWRRGAAFADLAAAYAKAGRTAEARKLTESAERYAASIKGWQQKRILAHVAQATALLGDREKAFELAQDLAVNDPKQYAARSLATVAIGEARVGNFEQAMEPLSSLDGKGGIYETWWRTVGYLEVSKAERLTREQQLRALDAAMKAAETIPNWKRIEALQMIGERAEELGNEQAAHAVLQQADALARPLPSTMPVKARLLSAVASGWARLGQKKPARELLSMAEMEIPATLVIDRPGLYAEVAGRNAEMGDDEEASRLYSKALSAAEGLENARPRALAVVEICRSMGRRGMALSASTRARLDGLYEGLGDPW
jgi:tetratricopeptide (TPR) repeat protein